MKYIAFRGTLNAHNMFSDANTFLSTSSFMKGRVHKGFYNVFKGLWPKVRSELVNIADKNNTKIEDLKYTFTGHSMGEMLQKLLPCM
ncbi:hypothetical protein OAP56_00510 [Rickettsiaceae bacterium]|nr:hypothetical protein [Rickettsiaceae bacterium]